MCYNKIKLLHNSSEKIFKLQTIYKQLMFTLKKIMIGMLRHTSF